MSISEKWLIVVLRCSAAILLLATLAVFLPFGWMARIHGDLGMGPLPDAAVVRYLTRSLSALYAIFGGLTLIISSDLRRYWDLVTYWAVVHIVLGVVLLVVDAAAGLPRFWTLSEGPSLIVIGLVVLFLQRGTS